MNIGRFGNQEEDQACLLCREVRYHGVDGDGPHFYGTKEEYAARIAA